MTMMRATAVLTVAAALVSGTAQAQQPARANEAPQFQVEPFWPQPLPGNWILGQVAGIAVDRNDHVWIVHRPATLVDDEKGATKNPPETKCCTAAPAVLEFDAGGMVLTAFGRINGGNAYGDQALAERFLNLFYRI